ncbi:hypothetical protein ACTXMZ_16615 [Brachybacterium alimentarium]|uniref:hypothetical protein n=1 Tax=Brachybacterium alimentarium TaxID=47845 RepID=UPI003FD22CC9
MTTQSLRASVTPGPGSDYWPLETPVLQHRHLEHDFPVPVFGELNRWDLRSLGWNPAAGRHSAVLRFDRFVGEWNLCARELAIAQLNPVHSIVRRQGVHLAAQPVHVRTIRAKLDGLRRFASWYTDHFVEVPLRELRQADLDRFLIDAKQHTAPSAVTSAVGAIRDLHTYDALLTGGGISFRPWGDETTAAVSGRRVSAELSTPVIPPAVWWPLLRSCWQYIDVFSNDIFNAADEWAALDRPSGERRRVTDPGSTLEAWLDAPGSHVPLHRLTYGRFTKGDIHWALLSLLVSDGHSKHLFTDARNPAVRSRRQEIRDALKDGRIRSVPGGLLTRPTEVERLDGSRGPWIDGFDPATIREQIKILRNACYVFCAALTMMRDSELLSIKKGSLTTFHGSPAVTSQLRKGRNGTRRRNWWIIEPVAQAIAVAERLALNDEVFGSTRRNHQHDERLARFDRHDELGSFISEINALGQAAGFDPIPETHLAPHMFRRTMAVITTQQPDGEIALGIQLKHAARRAVANATTTGYASETPEWAAEFEHELQDAVAARLVGLWTTKDGAGTRLAGAGAQRFRDKLARVEDAMTNGATVGDERTLRSLLRDRFSTLRWGTINHCLGIPEQAACLEGMPADVAADGVMPNRCQPATCRNSVVTDEHAPIWIAEEQDLIQKLKDRRMAPDSREQLESELVDVQRITRRFPDA